MRTPTVYGPSIFFRCGDCHALVRVDMEGSDSLSAATKLVLDWPCYCEGREPLPKCALCFTDIRADGGILCPAHEDDRLLAASMNRIAQGGRLTYSNAGAYSQANYVEMVKR